MLEQKTSILEYFSIYVKADRLHSLFICFWYCAHLRIYAYRNLLSFIYRIHIFFVLQYLKAPGFTIFSFCFVLYIRYMCIYFRIADAISDEACLRGMPKVFNKLKQIK